MEDTRHHVPDRLLLAGGEAQRFHGGQQLGEGDGRTLFLLDLSEDRTQRWTGEGGGADWSGRTAHRPSGCLQTLEHSLFIKHAVRTHCEHDCSTGGGHVGMSYLQSTVIQRREH